jgi:hypothetical protein
MIVNDCAVRINTNGREEQAENVAPDTKCAS